MTTDRVAVVTGAAGSLGRSMVSALLSSGYDVVGHDLPDPLAEIDPTLSTHPRFSAVPGDVTEPESVDRLAAWLDDRFGRVDVLVNNAAIDTKVTPGSSGEPISPADALQSFPVSSFAATLATNVLGPFLVVQACLPLLRRSAHASIINIASFYGIRSPNQGLYRDAGVELFKGPDYPASKAALISFSDYLATTLGYLGIRSNAICPGGVDLGQDQGFVDAYAKGTPLGRMATPSDVSGAVLFLASPESGYITGHSLVVDGGRSTW